MTSLCTRGPRTGASAHYDDVQRPRTGDALDTVEFDVAGGTGAADERQRFGRVEGLEGLRHGVDDLVGAHDADVVIRDQGQRPPPLTGAAVEHDRPGGGDPEGAAGDDHVERVEFERRQFGGRPVDDDVTSRPPRQRQVRRDDGARPLRDQPGDDLGDRALVGAMDLRAVVVDGVGEEFDVPGARRGLQVVVAGNGFGGEIGRAHV